MMRNKRRRDFNKNRQKSTIEKSAYADVKWKHGSLSGMRDFAQSHTQTRDGGIYPAMNEAEKRGREFLKSRGYEDRIIDFKNTDITAESTALALDVDVDRICKGLAFKGKGGTAVVVIASGRSRVNNGKFRNVLGFRPTMLPPDQTEELIGHIAGTINPFCLKDTARLYLDMSIMKHRGETVFPGIGGEDSVVELTVDELEKLSDPVCWVDVTM